MTLGLSHILGREIGPRYGVPHGYTSAILLPHVMQHLLPATRDRQSLIAVAAGRNGSPELAPIAVHELVARLELPQRLRDVDVPESDLESLASSRHGVIDILRAAW